MEGEMIFVIKIFYFCLFLVVLISAVGVIVFIEKRLSHSSWFRNILAVIAGIGASLVSLFMVHVIGDMVALNNSYVLIDSSMTDEMVMRKQSELRFNLSVIYLLVCVSEILVSILGGYIGGKVARQNEIVFGFLIGLGFVLFSLSFEDGYFLRHPINSLGFVLIYTARFCSTAFGGYIALFQRKRNQANLITTGEA
jgi:uncharacterized membrane protein (DUF485 family)